MHGGHTVARPESGFLFHVLNIYFSKSVKIFRQMNTRSVASSEIFVTLVQIILEREIKAICFHLQLNLHSRVSEDWGKVLVVVILFFKKKSSNLGLFCLFSFFSHYNSLFILKKHRSCGCDSNPGWHDDMRRRIHYAMAARP